MRGLAMRGVAAIITAGVLAAVLPSAPGRADPVLVFPGMRIDQDNHLCTLGYVDLERRVAVTAGHCRGGGPVTDKDGNLIGTLASFRENTPNGATVNTDQQIADYETIALADDVALNNILPDGRPLESEPGLRVRPGEPVCHFGVVTGESCGTVESVNNGWFTMGHGVISHPGDSGGPVYVIDNGGPARIVGIFNSTWGEFPAAVSWQAVAQQVRDDVGVPSGAVASTLPWPPVEHGAPQPADVGVGDSTKTGIAGAAVRSSSSLDAGVSPAM